MQTRTRTRLGVIDGMMNLACSHGHRHFSPTPEAWVGKRCLAPKKDADKCQLKLKRVKSDRERSKRRGK